MRSQKVVRFFIYLIFGIIILWVINTIANTYFIVKGDIAHETFKKDMVAVSIENEKENIFYDHINNHISFEQYDKAIEELKFRKKLYPEDSEFLIINIGDVYKLKGDLKSAYDCYKQIAVKTNYNVKAFVNMAEINLQWGKLEDAIYDYKIAASWNYDYYFDLGLLQEKSGDLKNAHASLDSFLLYNPQDKSAQLKLESIKFKIGKLPK